MEITAIKSTFKKYPAYTDSGVEWLGEIPAHWELISNKNIFKLNKNQVGKKSSDYTLLSLTLKGVINRVLEDGGKFPAEFDTYQEVKKGDFVFCLFDVEETPRCVGLSQFEGMITGAYTVMEVKPKFDKKFLYYFYLNLDADKRLRPLYTGLRNTISKDNFFAFKTFIPPLQEQTAIANFLDDKTAKIDLAIAQKEKMIALLKERKQIIIQNAVTKGLNPNAKMKNSGVEWIGEVPEGWGFISLKYILKERNERSEEGKEPILMMSQVHGLVIRSDYHDKAEVAQTTVGNKIVHTNDLVFNKLKAHLGVFFKSTLPFNGIVSPDYAVYYSNGILKDMKYLELLFRHPAYISQFICKATGIVEGLIRLYTSELFSIKVTVPPNNEQEEILDYIEAQSAKIDKAIALQERQIEKLKELKSTLIDSAVTGKIKVC
jgi:type I restriction enzyme S subunit